MPAFVADLAHGLFQSAQHDFHAGLRVAGIVGQLSLHSGQHIEQRDAAAGHDALFHSGAGRGQGVLDAQLALLHLDLGRGAHLDDGHAAGQLGQALLELLLVVIAGGVLDLRCGWRRRGP